MKTEEDEAFDDIARRQGAWGGGFQAKRQAAMDKVNAEFSEEYIKYRTASPNKGYMAPKQEPVHWSDCAVHNGPAYPKGECDCGAEKEQEEDWGALAEKQLASIKRDTQASLEDAMVRATHKVMAEFEAQPAQKTEREALKLAIDGLEKILHTFAKDGKVVMASMIRNELFAEVNSLLQQAKASLAQPAQEPVGTLNISSYKGHLVNHDFDYFGELPDGTYSVYTAPPQRPWVGLTEAEIELYWDWEDWQTGAGRSTIFEMVRDIEARLRSKNT